MSKVFGVSMMKDERDVVEGCVRHMAGEVHEIIIADNGSTDGTREILDQLATELPLTIVDDPEIGYFQSVKMSGLAALAAEKGATHILPFDGDEIWTAPSGRIRDVLGAAGLVDVASAALTHHLRTAIDVVDDDPFRSMVWHQPEPARLPKVAFRFIEGAVIHQGNHGVTLPDLGRPVVRLQLLDVRHFPVRSPEQLTSKARNGAAAYAATDLDPDQGAHWRSWGEMLERGGPAAVEGAFREHWFYTSPLDQGLVRDPAPYRRWEKPPGKKK